MKTIREKAREYAGCERVPDRCSRCLWIPEEYTSCCNRLQYKAFLAGHEEAFKWICVEDGLPKFNKRVMLKDSRIDAVTAGIFCTDDTFYTDNKYIGTVTHWREIELED